MSCSAELSALLEPVLLEPGSGVTGQPPCLEALCIFASLAAREVATLLLLLLKVARTDAV